ncbi:MAG: penicillin acylase family protein [Thermoleophilia bacterium]|nr:penicillin acylase family protein [Thermoleophilia bacterium]
MRRLTALTALLIFAIFGLAPTANAATRDYSATALNIIPSGQYGIPGIPGNDTQAKMYDGLTPLFNKVTNNDLNTLFKSERLGISDAGPGIPEVVPRAGVTITRDSYHVPHVKATTYNGGIWVAGWIAAEDRGLLLQQARYNARVAAIDAPHLSAIGLVSSLASFEPSAQTEAAVAKQTDALLAEGKEGKGVLQDIDTYITGINDYLTTTGSTNDPWTRNDVYAVNALKDQFLGEGGGDEARRSQFLGGLNKRLGAKKGWKVFNDLRQHTTNRSPISIDGNFPYEPIPKKSRKGSVVLDPDSFVETSVTPQPVAEELKTPDARATASNTLMITKKHSATGRPLMVGGPQIGYFYPGLTYEIDMDAPGLKWRGATSAPFPGYLLIGRGQDFATTLTSASGDVIDQFAETLCGGSDTKYLYKGKCRSMGNFDAGTLTRGGVTEPVSFKTTVHGPVVGYATVKGKKIALASKRSSYGKDVLDLMFNRRLSNGTVKSPKTFFKAAARTPQTFNSFYIDNNHVAEYTSGRLPMRDKRVDPGLPTKGTGQYEWKGYLSADGHPHGTDPKSGTMVNWNNSVAHKFGSADDEWGRAGTVARVDMLNKNLKKNKRNGKWTMAAVASAMNAGATQDVRSVVTTPLLAQLLKGSKAPNATAAGMLKQMVAWNKKGSSRLDRDLNGEIDAPGAASMDAAWAGVHDGDPSDGIDPQVDGIADAFMRPVLGPQLDELDSLFSRFDAPPSGQYAGWYQYFDRDIRGLLGKKTDNFRVSYCGHGKKAKCQKAVWTAIAKAGDRLTAAHGTSNPADWHANAVAERINFGPLPLIQMRYTNRPSGIQQVISFKGHR